MPLYITRVVDTPRPSVCLGVVSPLIVAFVGNWYTALQAMVPLLQLVEPSL